MATINGTSLNDFLVGGIDDDFIYGNAGNDILEGGAGNDWLYGGTGADTMRGGLGNDFYEVNDAGDVVDEAGGDGFDTVSASVTFSSTDIEYVTLTGTMNINAYLTGSSGNTLIGNSGNNILSGGAGNDTLNGGAGNDTLIGNLGADTMLGGLGDDIYYVDDIGDVVDETGGGGTQDKVLTSVSFTSAVVERVEMSGTANINATLTGTSSNAIHGNSGTNVLTSSNSVLGTLFGYAGNDTLISGAGNDWLVGGLGADVMRGGLGNDLYEVDDIGDVVDETGGGGTLDRVNSSLSFSSLDIEQVTLTGAASINATLSGSLANTLTGNTGANVLTSGGGNDTLTGNAGNDTLNGGAGNDTLNGGADADVMRGGLGDDTYTLDNIGDVVDEAGGGGTLDTVNSSVSFSSADIESITLTGTAAVNATLSGSLTNTLTGNSGDNVLTSGGGHDTLTGGAGNDTLNGGAGNDYLTGDLGADVMRGGLGNDNYFVDNIGDIVDETGGGGTQDRVDSSVTVSLSGIERVTLTGTANINATVSGSAAITVTGNSGVNVLISGSGNDNLNGGIGADVMRGGLGNDYYYVDDIGDVVDETGGGGAGDRIITSISFASADVEQILLTGTGNINGSLTDGLSNSLYGNTGNNVLMSGAGNDYLEGIAGNDTLNGGSGNDTLNGGAGLDVFQFDTALNATTNLDRISDFSVVDDTMSLDDAVFTALGATGVLAANLFKNLSLGAIDADDLIVYDGATGAVYYDADGSGAGASVQFAVLTGNPAITELDFVVV